MVTRLYRVLWTEYGPSKTQRRKELEDWERIMDPFKGIMKIKSPSKVFGEYGENIVNGGIDV